jgi:hypothetical protein
MNTETTELRRAVEVLSEPGSVVELRAIKNGATAAGYFDDPEVLAGEAAKPDEQGFSVYPGTQATQTTTTWSL